MIENQDATGVTESTFDLLEFVNKGTVATREVVIYTDHEAAARCQTIQDELDDLEDDGDDARKADAPLGSKDAGTRRAELEAEAESYLERLSASRMTWRVRALSQTEIEAVFEAYPDPKLPIPPKEGAAQALHDRWQEALEARVKEKGKVEARRNLALIAAAVESVETPAGATDTVSVDQLAALRERPHGAAWIDKLYAAVDEASSEDVAPPVPTSPGRSTSTRG